MLPNSSPAAEVPTSSHSDKTPDPTPAETKTTERPAVNALYWLARHQMRTGNWSLQNYARMCKGPACTDMGEEEALSAATAAALLPFLAAGQTHRTNGPFRKTIARAINWLSNHQRTDGDLSADARGKHSWMFAHALACVALCECYGMSRDRVVGRAAQRAVNFIQKTQDAATGGWSFRPIVGHSLDRDRRKHFDGPDFDDEGDISVVAWQLVALKSAQTNGLSVDPATLERAKRWLQSVAVPGTASDAQTYGRFSYRPGGAPSLTASAMGLWCMQALHVRRDDPIIIGGVPYLMKHPPDPDAPDIVYWYFANRVMFNMNDRNWEVWYRKLRGILVSTHIREGCAAGSWDADKPSGDLWGAQGGRVMTTSFAALILFTFHRWQLPNSETF